MDKEPANVDYLTHRAQCYYDMGNFEHAIADLETALTEDPANPEVLYR